jgi:hypothetical protein
MPIRHELIIEPRDIDNISIQCASCKTRVLLSRKAIQELNARDIPAKCPACPDDWTGVHGAVQEWLRGLKGLEAYDVAFHVTGTGGKTHQPVGTLPQTEGGE